MIHCNSQESCVRAEHFCASTTAESRAKIWYQYNAFKHPVALAAVRSKGVVLLLLIVTPIVGFCNCSMFCSALLCVHSSFAIISMGKRELIALLCLSSWCLEIVVWLFLTIPRACLQFVIVVFPDHTQLLFCLSEKITVLYAKFGGIL